MLLISFSIIGQVNNDDYYTFKTNKDRYLTNDDSCDIDTIAPIFILFNGKQTKLLHPYNKATIFPKNLIITAQDNCTDSVDLIYKFWHGAFLSEFPDSISLSNKVNVFDSLELSEDYLGTQELYVIIYDKQGNYSYSSTYLIVSCDTCGDPILNPSLYGRIYNNYGEPINTVNIQLTGSHNLAFTTKDNGEYSFTLEGINRLEVIPYKEGRPLNGVTSFDLILIKKHILGLQSFDDPYKFLAADVDFSGLITTRDIILIQKVLLGLEDSYPSGESWVFVLDEYQFQTPNPASEHYPTSWKTEAITGNTEPIDFIGIKLGDVNYTHSTRGKK